MTAATARTNRSRNRLSSNENEIIVADEYDTEAHRLASNENETIVADESDTEGHRLSSNDNETVVVGATEDDPEADDEDSLATAGLRRRAR